jgi:NAD+ kinase
MRKINNIKLYCNENVKSNEVLIDLKKLLEKNDFNIVTEKADLVIAIGGDGAFLRMVKSEQYDSNLIYVGINAGTLGFLQEIKKSDIANFISCLNDNSYRIEEVGVQETDVYTDNNKEVYYSLNEIVIREKDLNTAYFKVSIKNNLLENYVGDGLLIATSVGSTAYNLSFGGSIVYNTFHTLQITPIAPLNSKAYRNLMNSVIVPEKDEIRIAPINNRSNLLLSIDGDNKVFDNVKYIDTKVDSKRLRVLRLNSYNYWEKVNEKFLAD